VGLTTPRDTMFIQDNMVLYKSKYIYKMFAEEVFYCKILTISVINTMMGSNYNQWTQNCTLQNWLLLWVKC